MGVDCGVAHRALWCVFMRLGREGSVGVVGGVLRRKSVNGGGFGYTIHGFLVKRHE